MRASEVDFGYSVGVGRLCCANAAIQSGIYYALGSDYRGQFILAVFATLAYLGSTSRLLSPFQRNNSLLAVSWFSISMYTLALDADPMFFPFQALQPMAAVFLGHSSPIFWSILAVATAAPLILLDIHPHEWSPFWFPPPPSGWTQSLFRLGALVLFVSWCLFLIMYFERRIRMLVKTKQRILATLSHEIRTPLHSLLFNATELAHRSELKDLSEIQMLLRDSSYLVDLTSSVLDLSKMETGEVGEPDLAIVEVQQFVQTLQSLIHGVLTREILSGHSRISVTVKAMHPLQAFVRIDQARLTQIVLNYVSNALRYAKGAGKIRVKLSQVDRPPDGAILKNPLEQSESYLLITVADDGPGVRLEVEENLFTAFSSGNPARGATSLGLGLAICQMNAERLGGSVYYQRLTRQSVFGVIVPLQAVSAEEVLPVEAPRSELGHEAKSIRILAVDDEPMNLMILKKMLMRSGWNEVVTASSVQEAVALAIAQPFDLFLLDFQMGSDETGLDVLTRLKEQHNVAPRLGALILSAHALQGVRDRCDIDGVVGYMLKPFTREKLEQALAAIVI